MKDRIKRVRKHAHLTQVEFGEKIGISRTGLQKLEAGENNPSEQTIRAICREFGIRRQWLEEGVGPMFVPLEEDGDIFSTFAQVQFNTLPRFEQEAIIALLNMPGGINLLADIACFIMDKMASLIIEIGKKHEKEE